MPSLLRISTRQNTSSSKIGPSDLPTDRVVIALLRLCPVATSCLVLTLQCSPEPALWRRLWPRIGVDVEARWQKRCFNRGQHRWNEWKRGGFAPLVLSFELCIRWRHVGKRYGNGYHRPWKGACMRPNAGDVCQSRSFSYVRGLGLRWSVAAGRRMKRRLYRARVDANGPVRKNW